MQEPLVLEVKNRAARRKISLPLQPRLKMGGGNHSITLQFSIAMLAE